MERRYLFAGRTDEIDTCISKEKRSRIGLLIFGFYFTSKILLVKVHLLVNRNNIVKKTLSEMKC